jgi:hypothetical protein
MKRIEFLKSILFILLFAMPGLNYASTAAEQSRDQSVAEKDDILRRLYAAKPEAKDALRRSGGFATFKGLGAGDGGRRKGIAVIRSTWQDVFMTFEEK